MNRKFLIGLATLVLGAAAVTAQAGDRYHHGYRYGYRPVEVVRVVPAPRVRYVPAPVARYREDVRVVRPNAGALVGGIVGAVIGNQIGEGRNPVATVGGAVLGAVIGNEIARDDRGYRYPHR